MAAGGKGAAAAVPVIGLLDSRAAAASSYQVAAFRQGLSEAGFIEGRNVAIEFRWAEGQLDRLPSERVGNMLGSSRFLHDLRPVGFHPDTGSSRPCSGDSQSQAPTRAQTGDSHA